MSPNDDTQPPRLMLKSTKDALLIIEAAERGLFPRLVRRLTEQERAESIFSGAVFVYDEFESHIRRFTDTLVWSPSRIVGNYLVYREMRKHEPRPTSRAGASIPLQPAAARSLARPRPETLIDQSERDRKKREQQYVGSLTNNAKFKPDGLVKRTFSLMCEGKHIHVIAYYTYDDAMNEAFVTPSEYPQFADLPISQELLQDKSMYRVPPRIEKLANGKLVYAGEDSDKPTSPRSDSASLEPDRDSPAASASTGGTPDLSTLPSLLPLVSEVRSHTPAQDESMFDLPPLRPLNARLTWDETATPTSSTFNGPPYTTHSRLDPTQYAFPKPSGPNTTSLGFISVPSLTPTSRVIPRLRDSRQQPYPTHERPNNTSLNIARSLREPEHTPTDPSFAPALAQSFDPGPGPGMGYNVHPPSYHEQPATWDVPPVGFNGGGFGMRGEGRGQPVLAPVPERTRLAPRPYEYEVGPSGERAEYDVPGSRYGSEWRSYDGVGSLYPPDEGGNRGYQ